MTSARSEHGRVDEDRDGAPRHARGAAGAGGDRDEEDARDRDGRAAAAPGQGQDHRALGQGRRQEEGHRHEQDRRRRQGRAERRQAIRGRPPHPPDHHQQQVTCPCIFGGASVFLCVCAVKAAGGLRLDIV